MMEKIRHTGALLYIALALGIGGIGMAIGWLVEQVKVAKFVLWDLQRFFMGRYTDEATVSSAPPPPTPTHADPRSLAKHALPRALRNLGFKNAVPENTQVHQDRDQVWDCFCRDPAGTWYAYGQFHEDEYGGYVRVVFWVHSSGRMTLPDTLHQPHQTKESP